MYFCAPCLARFFVLCQVYSSSRHLKNAPFAARLADLNPPPRLRPAYLNKEERATRAAYCQPLNKEEQPRPRAACGLWLVVGVSMFARSTRTP